VHGRTSPDMSNDRRFEFRLPGPVRRELSELADQTGLSRADLVRSRVMHLLRDELNDIQVTISSEIIRGTSPRRSSAAGSTWPCCASEPRALGMRA
jgi:hypothetical protein